MGRPEGVLASGDSVALQLLTVVGSSGGSGSSAYGIRAVAGAQYHAPAGHLHCESAALRVRTARTGANGVHGRQRWPRCESGSCDTRDSAGTWGARSEPGRLSWRDEAGTEDSNGSTMMASPGSQGAFGTLGGRGRPQWQSREARPARGGRRCRVVGHSRQRRRALDLHGRALSAWRGIDGADGTSGAAGMGGGGGGGGGGQAGVFVIDGIGNGGGGGGGGGGRWDRPPRAAARAEDPSPSTSTTRPRPSPAAARFRPATAARRRGRPGGLPRSAAPEGRERHLLHRRARRRRSRRARRHRRLRR